MRSYKNEFSEINLIKKRTCSFNMTHLGGGGAFTNKPMKTAGGVGCYRPIAVLMTIRGLIFAAVVVALWAGQ